MGLTSAVSATLGAADATAGALGWDRGWKDPRFRAVWAVILVIGVALATLGHSPVAAILFAQAANGILLPVVAVFLLIVMNRSDLLGRYTNGVVANVLGAVVVLTVSGLGGYKLLTALGLLP